MEIQLLISFSGSIALSTEYNNANRNHLPYWTFLLFVFSVVNIQQIPATDLNKKKKFKKSTCLLSQT